MDNTEIERADQTRAPGLDQDAFRAAWDAMQNCPIDLIADSDDEQCRVLGVAIAAYLGSVEK